MPAVHVPHVVAGILQGTRHTVYSACIVRTTGLVRGWSRHEIARALHASFIDFPDACALSAQTQHRYRYLPFAEHGASTGISLSSSITLVFCRTITNLTRTCNTHRPQQDCDRPFVSGLGGLGLTYLQDSQELRAQELSCRGEGGV